MSEKREAGRATPAAARFRASWVRARSGLHRQPVRVLIGNTIPANQQNLQLINDSAKQNKLTVIRQRERVICLRE